jgi:septum formation protein
MKQRQDFKIILASGSPRRKEILELAGIKFELRKNNAEESYPNDLELKDIAEYLARLKADHLQSTLAENELMITADTIVAFDGKEYGKPKDREDSIRMLLLLSNNTHEVYSGVCICDKHKKLSFTCKSIVKLAKISRDEAAWYFDNYDPSDKAGSYGIQDWIGITKVEWIKGSYNNILGLPVAQTLEHLNAFIKNK